MASLKEYDKKRNFKKTTEPKSAKKKSTSKLIFVIHEHHASHLHYDFRLEWEGVLKSWAVPKGVPLIAKEKRLAVEVEDHPYDYAKFSGTIPKGEYGAGEVFIWDEGNWEPLGDVNKGLKKGHLQFLLKGHKLNGAWDLVRTKKMSGKKNQWLLIKRTDSIKAPTLTKINFVEPQLALLVDKPPKGKDWIHEIKLDGYRVQAHIANDGISLFTRKGFEWSEKFKGLLPTLRKLEKYNVVLDGEIVCLDPSGHSHFQLLQKAIKEKNFDQMVFYAFDVLFFEGKDLRLEPLNKRKLILKKVFKNFKAPHVKMVETFDVEGAALLKNACQLGLEGIISKNLVSIYRSGRYPEWTKSKCGQRQEFVIGGYTEPQGNRDKFGALLLGVFEKGKLRYCGRVGTGFDRSLLNDIFEKLEKLKVKKSLFQINPPKEKKLNFVKPELVAEIAFANWTEDKHLRAAVFEGLREDKPAVQISKETKKSSSKLKISNPDKIFFQKEKISKGDVSEYYDQVSDFLLPHLEHRPLSIVRCPNGTSKACFFQKHDQKSAEWITVSTHQELKQMIQLGTIELHPWGSKEPQLDVPDQIIMDLDPDDSVSFSQVVKAAFTLKQMLDDIKIKSYVKVTGGKGVHVQFAFAALYTWPQIKTFAATLAHEMVTQNPKLFVDKMSKSLRKGKIFIDHFRNGKGSTAVAPYCLRARDISAVAMPVTWEELKKLGSANVFTLEKAQLWLKKRKKDPWSDYFLDPQQIALLDQMKK